MVAPYIVAKTQSIVNSLNSRVASVLPIVKRQGQGQLLNYSQVKAPRYVRTSRLCYRTPAVLHGSARRSAIQHAETRHIFVQGVFGYV